MLKFQINIPVYSFKCTVIIDDNIGKTIDRYMKRFKMPMEQDKDVDYDGLAIYTPLNSYYIFYSIHSLTPNIIVHEISHIVDYIIENKDIEHLGEARAYLTGYITEKVFDFILKNNLLISKYTNYSQKDPLSPSAHVAE